MRVDPEGVYLELRTGANVLNLTTGATRNVPVVTMHWKDGNRWQRRSFCGDGPDGGNGKTLEDILGKVGAWIDQHGLQGALDQASGRAA